MERYLDRVCSLSEVESKHVSMDLVVRDVVVERLWLPDTMARKATRGLLRCRVRQLEHAVPSPLARGWLPPVVRVHALGPHEKLHVLSTGKMLILSISARAACLEFVVSSSTCWRWRRMSVWCLRVRWRWRVCAFVCVCLLAL